MENTLNWGDFGNSLSTSNDIKRIEDDVVISQVESLKTVGRVVEGTLFIKQKSHLITSSDNKPYTRYTLTDGKSNIAAFAWGETIKEEGSCMTFRAMPKTYQDDINLTLQSWDIYDVPEDMLPVELDINNIILELTKYRGVGDADFRQILDILIFEDTSEDNPFFSAPSAIYHHHNEKHALALHTLEVVKMAHLTAHTYGLNVDLAITGALLHDIGKTRVYTMKGITPHFVEEYTTTEHLLQGSYILMGLVDKYLPNIDRRKLDLLNHIIISHHGELEYGAIVKPMTREALAVYMADQMSAKMDMFNRNSKESDKAFLQTKIKGDTIRFMNNKYVEHIMSGNVSIEGR